MNAMASSTGLAGGLPASFPDGVRMSSATALSSDQRKAMVSDWLPRYTGMPIEEFRKHIVLTNFHHYVDVFAKKFGVPVRGVATAESSARPMQAASSDTMTIVNLGIGSAAAALVMDLLSAIEPEAALFLGKCGGVKHDMGMGELILPTAGIRGEGASHNYFPAEVPAMPAFALQKAVSDTLQEAGLRCWTGPVFTTEVRVWEWNERFKDYLRNVRALAVDMETATLFCTGFFNKIPTGALLLVSDLPMTPEGIKTEASDREVTKSFVGQHLELGLSAMQRIVDKNESVRHLKTW
jgi:AMP nucleosidase